jgi:hypothetical protein
MPGGNALHTELSSSFEEPYGHEVYKNQGLVEWVGQEYPDPAGKGAGLDGGATVWHN